MVAMQGLRACLNSRFVLATGMASWFERDSNGSLRASSVAFKPVRRAGMMRWLKPVDSGDLGDFTRDDRFVSARIPRSRNKRTLRPRLSTCLPHRVPGVPKVPLLHVPETLAVEGGPCGLRKNGRLRPLRMATFTSAAEWRSHTPSFRKILDKGNWIWSSGLWRSRAMETDRKKLPEGSGRLA